MHSSKPTVDDKATGPKRSLDSIVATFGARVFQHARPLDLSAVFPILWPQKNHIPKKLAEIAEAVLNEYLETGGYYVERNKGVYVVVYPNLPISLAEIKHLAIVQEVERRGRDRFGPKEDKAAQAPTHKLSWEQFEQFCSKTPDVIRLGLDLSEIIFGTGNADAKPSKRMTNVVDQVLEDFLGEGCFYTSAGANRVILVFPNTSPALAKLKRDAIVSEIVRQVEKLSEEIRPKAKEKTEHFVPAPPRKTVPNQVARMQAEQAAAWSAALAEAAKARETGFDPTQITTMPEDHNVHYQPMWRVSSKMLTAYLLEARPKTPPPEDDFVKRAPFGEIIRDLSQPDLIDLPVIAQAARDLTATMRTPGHAVLMVPVHFATLDRAANRSLFLEICSQLSEESRKYLVLELVGIPEDLALFRLEERIRQLKPFTRALLLRTRLATKSLAAYKDLGVHAVGIDLGEYRAQERLFMSGFDDLNEQAEKHRLLTYVYGLNSLSLTAAAIASGFSYVGGTAVSPKMKRPFAVEEFDAGTLYQRGISLLNPEAKT